MNYRYAPPVVFLPDQKKRKREIAAGNQSDQGADMLADFLLPLCAFYYIQRTLWGGKKATFSIVLTLTGFVTRNDEKYFLHFINFLQTYFIGLSKDGTEKY